MLEKPAPVGPRINYDEERDNNYHPLRENHNVHDSDTIKHNDEDKNNNKSR